MGSRDHTLPRRMRGKGRPIRIRSRVVLHCGREHRAIAMTIDPKKVKDRGNLDVLLHVPLSITAELGTCKMSVSEVLKLGAGSIIELDRLAGGPVDLLVNNKLIARGEVVAVDENFGVRITELISKPI
jgi:flagellar motor switch protein FliN